MKCQSKKHDTDRQANNLPPAVAIFVDGINQTRIPVCEGCRLIADKLMDASRRMFGSTSHQIERLESGRPCGCDPGAGWKCEQHAIAEGSEP